MDEFMYREKRRMNSFNLIYMTNKCVDGYQWQKKVDRYVTNKLGMDFI